MSWMPNNFTYVQNVQIKWEDLEFENGRAAPRELGGEQIN